MWIIILVFLGGFFWFCNLGVLVLTRDWPVLLIFFGIVNMYGFFRKNKKEVIIQDLEKGKITPQEAEEKLKRTS